MTWNSVVPFVLDVIDALRESTVEVQPPFIVVAERQQSTVRVRARTAPPWSHTRRQPAANIRPKLSYLTIQLRPCPFTAPSGPFAGNVIPQAVDALCFTEISARRTGAQGD
jgi:hypothetical protein